MTDSKKAKSGNTEKEGTKTINNTTLIFQYICSYDRQQTEYTTYNITETESLIQQQ